MLGYFSDSDDEDLVSDLDLSSSDDDLMFEVLGAICNDRAYSSRKSSKRQKTEPEPDLGPVPEPDFTTEDLKFYESNRVDQKTFRKLVLLYQNSSYFNCRTTGGKGKIEATNQLSAYMRFAGHREESFRDIARIFNMAVSSLHRVINRCTYFFSNMSPSVIVWPTEEQRNESERHFARKGFPGVIGVLGCGHIQIDRPLTGSDSYVNSDDRHSIQLQIVCDHKCKIIDVFVGFPGSATPMEVFNGSQLSKTIEDKCTSGLNRILTTSVYTSTPYLTTPYTGELNESQKRFNELHKETTLLIHRCFALLHIKFPQLDHIKLKDFALVTNFVRACCVLHNRSIDDKLPPDEEERIKEKATQLQNIHLVNQH